MSFGDQYNTLKSLAAVDSWLAALNDNMQNSGMPGYRARRVTFGGAGEPNIQREASLDPVFLNIQRPDQLLKIERITTDFSLGEIFSSSMGEHLAINNDSGFFMLTTAIDVNNQPAAGAQYFVTRDGEFHWDSQGYLRSRQGHYVLGDDDGNPGTQLFAYNQAGIAAGDLTTGAASISAGDFTVSWDSAAGSYRWYRENADTGINIHTFTPGIDLQTLVPDTGEPSLFSFDVTDPYSVNAGTMEVVGFALEKANATMDQLVPELSLAQKMYQALTKVLQTYQTNLDNSFNIIR